MQIEMLGRTVVVVDDDRIRHRLDREVDRWLVIALVFASSGPLTYREAEQGTGLSYDSGALRKRVSRLKAGTRLPIQTVPQVGYRLDSEGLSVDALDYLDAVREARILPRDARRTCLDSARRLWNGGLPPFGDRLREPAPEIYRQIQRAEEETRSVGRRLLIVDDVIADRLAKRLRLRHHCTVVHDLEEFEALTTPLADFDLLVLDRHLGGGYDDQAGDDIAKRINSSITEAPPVFMITRRCRPRSRCRSGPPTSVWPSTARRAATVSALISKGWRARSTSCWRGIRWNWRAATSRRGSWTFDVRHENGWRTCITVRCWPGS